MMEDINVRSVRYPLPVDEKLVKIALKLGRTKHQVFIQMVDYFYKNKKDPLDLNDELLKNALMKNHKDYIGFIRKQEDMLLIPIKTEMDRMVASQIKIIDRFNGEVLKHNVDVLNKQNVHDQKLSAIALMMETIQKSLKSKEQLKMQFLHILDSYVKSRDAFGLMTSGKEKEELISVTKAQVSLL
ncbi:BfmA/BtgA family mobilization protein [Mucilaginibacter sp. UC70_90]